MIWTSMQVYVTLTLSSIWPILWWISERWYMDIPPLIINWFIPQPSIVHTFGDKTLQGGCETKNFEDATENYWKKQNPKFFPWRSNYEPKICHNNVDTGKNDRGISRVYFFKNCTKLKLCAQSSDYYLKVPGKMYLTLMRHTQVNFRKLYFSINIRHILHV